MQAEAHDRRGRVALAGLALGWGWAQEYGRGWKYCRYRGFGEELDEDLARLTPHLFEERVQHPIVRADGRVSDPTTKATRHQPAAVLAVLVGEKAHHLALVDDSGEA